MDDMTAKAVIHGILNRKAVEPDTLPAELLKLDRRQFIRCFRNLLVNAWRTGYVPEQYKYVTVKLRLDKPDRSASNNYRGIWLVAHSRKLLLKYGPAPPQNLLRGLGDAPIVTVRFSPSTINRRHGARRAPTARTRTSYKQKPVHVTNRPLPSK